MTHMFREVWGTEGGSHARRPTRSVKSVWGMEGGSHASTRGLVMLLHHVWCEAGGHGGALGGGSIAAPALTFVVHLSSSTNPGGLS